VCSISTPNRKALFINIETASSRGSRVDTGKLQISTAGTSGGASDCISVPMLLRVLVGGLLIKTAIRSRIGGCSKVR
jgi:hypothetical protein